MHCSLKVLVKGQLTSSTSEVREANELIHKEAQITKRRNQ